MSFFEEIYYIDFFQFTCSSVQIKMQIQIQIQIQTKKSSRKKHDSLPFSFFNPSHSGWQRDSSVRGADYEPFDSILRIEVRRVKRSQFDAVRTMLERCVVRKAVVQSFHPRDNISSNSHNRSTKKINDMSMSVRDGKILLVEKTTQMKSLRVVITSDRRICDPSTASISKRLHHIDSVVE